jgi:alcohol dehydrogenase class IV
MYYNHIYNTRSRFSFHSPTRIISYEGSRELLCEICQFRNSILVYDAFLDGSEFILGLRSKLNVVRSFVVRNEPEIHDFDELQDDALSNISYIVAVGGGSSIDFAKLLILRSVTDNFRSELNENDPICPQKIEIISVPTTCGSGSETSRYCVVFDENSEKRSYRHWDLAPTVALLDSWFLKRIRTSQLHASVFDSFLHNFEPFFLIGECDERTRMHCLVNAHQIINHLSDFASGRDDNGQRLMELSALGGVSISNFRTGLIHSFGETFVSFRKISHPRSLYVFFEAVLNLMRDYYDERRANQRSLGDNLSIDAIVKFWNSKLDGIFAGSSLSITQEEASLFLRKLNCDHVIFKESPFSINDAVIRRILNDSIRVEDRR